MTGWGQDGPMARAAGHDINYIALAGALDPIGPKGGKPIPPLNLVGDFGGGGMFLAYGVVCGLLEARGSGRGQVVDAAMVDGAATLMAFFRGMIEMGVWREGRGTNMLDGGAHFYDTYETSDGRHVSVGSIESQFYAELIEKTGLAGEELPGQMARDEWPVMQQRLEAIFKTKTRDEWCEIMEGSDVCFAPVLSIAEAPLHPHNVHRKSFVEIGGFAQPAPAPRFSRTEAELPGPAAHPGQHTDAALADWGFSPDELAKLRESKAIA
jgi:alpha-methylacyl-CoA racemase